MASCNQIASKLNKVVDLTVEDYPHRLVIVTHRLAPAREIDNTKAIKAETHVLVYEKTVIVGATVVNNGAHPVDYTWVDVASPVKVIETYDSTHVGI